MELILAIVVAAAVIFFGALISAGNERQRKAIDGLREQFILWAVRDLGIKREMLVRDIHLDDPLGWFNKIASNACGHDLNLQVIETFDNPEALVCANGDGGGKIIFARLSPIEIHTLKRTKHNHLSRYVDRNPLLALPHNVVVFECSVLNSGILFDVELPIAWKAVTGKSMDEAGFLWVYMVS